jgi:hypothetical protein
LLSEGRARLGEDKRLAAIGFRFREWAHSKPSDVDYVPAASVTPAAIYLSLLVAPLNQLFAGLLPKLL